MKDYKTFSSVFIRLLRGDENQVTFSEKMGYSFNICSRWENGQKRFMWEDFLKLCEYLKWDIAPMLKSVTNSNYSKLPDAIEVINALIQSDNDIKKLEQEFSSQKIRRLRLGVVNFQFTEYLQMLDCLYTMKDKFLHLLLGPELFQELYSKLGKYENTIQNLRNLVREDPSYSLLLECFRLGSYNKLNQHSDKFVSEVTGISVMHVTSKIETLRDKDIIDLDKGVYKVKIEEEHIDFGVSNKESVKLLSDSWRSNLSKIADGKSFSISEPKHSCILYQSNKDLNDKIFKLKKAFYRDIQNLINSTDLEKTDRLGYLTIDIFENEKINRN